VRWLPRVQNADTPAIRVLTCLADRTFCRLLSTNFIRGARRWDQSSHRSRPRKVARTVMLGLSSRHLSQAPSGVVIGNPQWRRLKCVRFCRGGGGRVMPDDRLWEIAGGVDWHLMIVACKTLAFGVLMVSLIPLWNSIRFWKQMRTIQTRLKTMQNEINVLQIQSSRLMAELSADSPAEIASAHRTEP
jgi:hypothetical protein